MDATDAKVCAAPFQVAFASFVADNARYFVSCLKYAAGGNNVSVLYVSAVLS